MTSESELTTTLLESYDDEERMEQLRVEEPYDHYGNRGVADLYTDDGFAATVYELKSEAALNHVTGANEIVRQFNKLRKYFFQGTGFYPRDRVRFELCFVPTERTINHVRKYQSLYRSSVDADHFFYDGVDPDIALTFRPADEDNIAPINTIGDLGVRSWGSASEWLEYVEELQPDVIDQHRESFAKLAETIRS